MTYYNKSHCKDETAGKAITNLDGMTEQERIKKTIDSMLVFAKRHGYIVSSKIILTRIQDAVQEL